MIQKLKLIALFASGVLTFTVVSYKKRIPKSLHQAETLLKLR